MINYTPRILANQLHDVRNFYAKFGWPILSCSIGFDSQIGMVKLACNDGAIDYQWRDDGRIVRTTAGNYSKLIEFVDGDIAPHIAQHNQRVQWAA